MESKQALPPVRVTTDGTFLYIVTDPDYLAIIAPIAKEFPQQAPMRLLIESKTTISNAVINTTAIGFSQEAIDLIRSAKVIDDDDDDDTTLLAAWESDRGATFAWAGPSTVPLPACMLTITHETSTFDFSRFQQIPNDVPGYSPWFRFAILRCHEV